MGGANVGPEFTSTEYLALMKLVEEEIKNYGDQVGGTLSNFKEVLTAAVVDSGRWKKWLQPDERGKDFQALNLERQDWLLQTGSRYIWTHPAVVEARKKLYTNLSTKTFDPDEYVVDQIAKVIEKYIFAFNLKNSITKLGL
jgi:tagatose-1,6-bisphosphate aldolase non-catalytic subunit AgaZ/GatZ